MPAAVARGATQFQGFHVGFMTAAGADAGGGVRRLPAGGQAADLGGRPGAIPAAAPGPRAPGSGRRGWWSGSSSGWNPPVQRDAPSAFDWVHFYEPPAGYSSFMGGPDGREDPGSSGCRSAGDCCLLPGRDVRLQHPGRRALVAWLHPAPPGTGLRRADLDHPRRRSGRCSISSTTPPWRAGLLPADDAGDRVRGPAHPEHLARHHRPHGEQPDAAAADAEPAARP